jgi:4-amino-4-deoxy-L-arabinose transferase-like glycosyltransferase
LIFEIKNNKLAVFLIGLISAVIFIPFIGNCNLFDWDEINFAECAREMLVTGNYSHVQLNFRPFWEKPPVFIWMQALSMNIFGVNEFAARFPNALCSIVSLISMYEMGRRFHSPKFGLTWCLLYAATLLPHFYFKSGIIDPWFNLFIFLSIYHCICFLNNPGGKKELFNALYAGIFLGLAVLTKGPAAMLIIAVTLIIFLIWNRKLKVLFSLHFIVFTITTLFVSGSWFLVEWMKGNGEVIKEFIDYQIRLFETEDSGHGGSYLYHVVVLLVGCFPSSIIFIASYMRYKDLTDWQKFFRKMMLCLFWTVLILFTVFVKTKIIHYSSLCYYPLTFVAAIGLTNYFQTLKFNMVLKIVYWIIAGLLSIGFILVGFTNVLKQPIIESGMIKDEFAVHSLMADVHWTGFEFLIGLLLLLASIVIYFGVIKTKSYILFYGLLLNLCFIFFAILVIVPKIEQYSQRAAIDFYKVCAEHDCYVETHGFKSYAQLFYGKRTKDHFTNPDQLAYVENQLNVMEEEGHSRLQSFSVSYMLWMENGKIDRPAYIVAKITEKGLAENPEMKKLYEKNGFSFYVRLPQSAK